MQVAINLSQNKAARTQAAAEHARKQEAILRCIENYANGRDIWMTYTEIAESTGLSLRDVVETMYNSGSLFLESSWRMHYGQIMVTVRRLYQERYNFWDKFFAVCGCRRD